MGGGGWGVGNNYPITRIVYFPWEIVIYLVIWCGGVGDGAGALILHCSHFSVRKLYYEKVKAIFAGGKLIYRGRKLLSDNNQLHRYICDLELRRLKHMSKQHFPITGSATFKLRLQRCLP